MKSSIVIKEVLQKFDENELIFASKIYREYLYEYMTEYAFYKALERMCKSGELVNIAKGTYHLPKVTKYGVVPPSEKEIVSAFTENGTGTVIGYSLYNALNLTTQISKTVTVMSSALEGFSKTIRNVMVHRADIEYSQPVENMIHCLEVLQNFSNIQDINYYEFFRYTKEFSKTYTDRTFQEVISSIKYKKSTIAFLQEVLRYYNCDNNLNEYLSELSEYKHPKMEEIYEAARVS